HDQPLRDVDLLPALQERVGVEAEIDDHLLGGRGDPGEVRVGRVRPFLVQGDLRLCRRLPAWGLPAGAGGRVHVCHVTTSRQELWGPAVTWVVRSFPGAQPWGGRHRPPNSSYLPRRTATTN